MVPESVVLVVLCSTWHSNLLVFRTRLFLVDYDCKKKTPSVCFLVLAPLILVYICVFTCGLKPSNDEKHLTVEIVQPDQQPDKQQQETLSEEESSLLLFPENQAQPVGINKSEAGEFLLARYWRIFKAVFYRATNV